MTIRFPRLRSATLAACAALSLSAAACGSSGTTTAATRTVGPEGTTAATERQGGTDSVSTVTPFQDRSGKTLARAVFATGCFWCTESDFDKLPGVVSTTSGYTGGTEARPSYDDVGGHRTSHVEAVQVVYDPAVVTYDKLLDYFWTTTDPTDDGGQFCDRGSPYRSAIFTYTDAQRASAEASKATIERTKTFPASIVTAIRGGGAFWAAEGYHQNFHVTTPDRYQSYRLCCGRDARLRQLWGAAAAH